MKGKRKSGFTLLELLVTATIMAVLTAIAITSYSSINKRSRDTKRRSDIEQIRSALEMYRAGNGYYPPVESELITTYLPLWPSDPISSQTYIYTPTDQSGGNYYGYCLSALLESSDPSDTCTPSTGNNYGVKNP